MYKERCEIITEVKEMIKNWDTSDLDDDITTYHIDCVLTVFKNHEYISSMDIKKKLSDSNSVSRQNRLKSDKIIKSLIKKDLVEKYELYDEVEGKECWQETLYKARFNFHHEPKRQ